MKVGSLFAGIGGFDLGLERAGFDIAWQVEIDPYCQRVLAKHWPAVTRYGDIREVDWHAVEPVDLLCGGFPCQDISLAGKGAGLTGERSGLWFEYAKAIAVLKPRYVLIENVSALRSRGLDQVLGSLAALGYDAEWHCIPACAVGAPHRRDRVWVMAHSEGERLNGISRSLQSARREKRNQFRGGGEDVAHSTSAGSQGYRTECELGESRQEIEVGGGGDDVADAISESTEGGHDGVERRQRGESQAARDGWSRDGAQDGWWQSEPDVGRVAHGVPARVDRLRGLGNAIVPQIAEWIGRQITHAQIQDDQA